MLRSSAYREDHEHSYGQQGRIEKARAQIAAFQALYPDILLLQHARMTRNELADLDHRLDGPRKAGPSE
jgi:hypothetical protein